jgi:hypothetical protein
MAPPLRWPLMATRGRAVEYRQMVSSVWASPETGISKARRSRALSPLIRRAVIPVARIVGGDSLIA